MGDEELLPLDTGREEDLFHLFAGHAAERLLLLHVLFGGTTPEDEQALGGVPWTKRKDVLAGSPVLRVRAGCTVAAGRSEGFGQRHYFWNFTACPCLFSSIRLYAARLSGFPAVSWYTYSLALPSG